MKKKNKDCSAPQETNRQFTLRNYSKTPSYILPVYDPSYCHKIIEIAAEGNHVATMCVELGIHSQTTFYKWVREHEEFQQAYEYARLVSLAYHEQLLKHMAVGELDPKGYKALMTTLHNKYPEEYKAMSGSTTSVELNFTNNVTNIDQATLDAKIESLNARLGLTKKPQEIEVMVSEVIIEEDRNV